MRGRLLLVFFRHLRNVVPIKPFLGDADDRELDKLRQSLMSWVKADDVREEIKDRYNLVKAVGLHGSFWDRISEDEEEIKEHEKEEEEEASSTHRTKIRRVQ